MNLATWGSMDTHELTLTTTRLQLRTCLVFQKHSGCNLYQGALALPPHLHLDGHLRGWHRGH